QISDLEAALELGDLLLDLGGADLRQAGLDLGERLLALGEEARALFFNMAESALGDRELLLRRGDGGLERLLTIEQSGRLHVIGGIVIRKYRGDRLLELGDLRLFAGDLLAE